MAQHYDYVSLIKANLYKIFVSIFLGLIGFIGIFFSSRFYFNGFYINFSWSITLPLLVTLAWGIKYGIISITLGLVILYPFILGSYNGWASFVPVISLYLWIIIHGYGGQKRLQIQRFYYNIYFLQFIHILIRIFIYLTLFPVLINLNRLIPPPWNTQAYINVEIGIIFLFAVKGIIVESIILALCDALLLLPFVRKVLSLKCSKGAKYNTRIVTALVAFGLSFTIIILWIQNYIIDNSSSMTWLIKPDEKTRITFLLATILFFIMGGITIRFVQRVLETQEALRVREKQLDKAIGEIKNLNDELEKRVKDRTSELQHAVDELEGFAYTISHDLKSPLRAIEAYSNFIQKDYSDSLNSEAGVMISSIQEICKEMIGLINKLLEYSVTSRASLSKEPLQPRETIEAVFYQLKSINPDRKMELIFEGELPEINVDRILFKQVIMNILSNAVKFSKAKEISKITAGCIKGHKEYIFYIKDNGVGFNMKYSAKLFNVFQRLHRKQDYEGAGIGLATIKKVIQKHGGRVWIEGILNEGAILYFTIPFAESIQEGGQHV